MKHASAIAFVTMILGCGAAPSAPTVEVGAQPVTTAAATANAPMAVPSAAPSAEPTTREAAEFGMIGLLNSGDADAPQGALVGGMESGVGIGTIGTLGKTGSPGTIGGGGRKPAQIRVGDIDVKGALPREVVQRIMRQNFGRFRLCYEDGLKARPDLKGRVLVTFSIDASGAVTGTSNGGSDLPDAKVVACVMRSMMSLSFPQPDDGKKVEVRYPLTFSPPAAAP
jgi:hypothetical protein